MSNSTQTADSPLSNSTSNTNRLLVAALVAILLLVVAANHWAGRADTQVGGDGIGDSTLLEANPAMGVTIEIEGGATAMQPITVRHRPLMTVLDTLKLASQASSAWEFTYQGQGELFMLTQIAGQTNQGEAGLNWQYDVNGRRAELGIGQQRVEPGDRVLWKFAPSE